MKHSINNTIQQQDLRNQIASLVNQYAELENSAAKPFIAGKTAIPPSGKVLGSSELQAMVNAVLDGWLTTGRFNDLFEQELIKTTGISHALTVNSGSSANLIALSALTSPELKAKAILPGDEVITLAAGFPTTITPILQNQAIPVFIDIESSTWNADTSQLELARSAKTKAVIFAHTLGNPFELKAVTEFCKKYELWLIEDCCDALGSTYEGKHVGNFGDFATLSFYPAHHITTGEGGAVLTNNKKLARIAESFRDWGRHCHCRPGQDNRCGKRFSGQYAQLPAGYDHKYVYAHAGYNLKMTDIQAACGLAQLARLSQFVQSRQENFRFLQQQLASCPQFELITALPCAKASWFGFPLLLKATASCSRMDLINKLNQAHIGTRLLFAGNATKQPFMQGRTFRTIGTLEHTDLIMEQAFWIGLYPGLSQEMLAYTAKTITTCLNSQRG